MGITTDASTTRQRKIVKDFIKGLGDKAKGISAQLNFDENALEFRYEDNRYLLPIDRFEDWAGKGFPFTQSGSPQLGRWKEDGGEPTEAPEEEPERAQEAPEEKPAPKPRKGAPKKTAPAQAKRQAPKKPKPKLTDEEVAAAKAEIKSVTVEPRVEGQTTAKAQREAPKPTPSNRIAIEHGLDTALRALAEEAYAIEEEQHSGELGANAARYKLGLLVLKLDDIKARAKEEGDERLGTRKALLEMLNKGQLAIADARGATRRFKPIEEGEATAMSKVAETFLGGDLSTRFKLVDTINPVTGEPLVGDDGEPPEVPVTEIAPSKLYPLVKHVTSDNFHRLVSFAHNYNEANVKTAVRFADKLEKPLAEVVKQITDLRHTIASPVTEKAVEAGLDDDGLKLWLREHMPASPPSPYYTITTERGWGESIWEPVKSVLAAINERYGFATPNEETGELSNVFVLERTFTQYFNPYEESGFQRIIGALITAGDISEEQGSELVGEYGFDPDTAGLRGRTEEEKAALFGEEAEAAILAEAEDGDDEGEDEPPFDADLDIDAPRAEEEGEAEGEDADDPDDF